MLPSDPHTWRYAGTAKNWRGESIAIRIAARKTSPDEDSTGVVFDVYTQTGEMGRTTRQLEFLNELPGSELDLLAERGGEIEHFDGDASYKLENGEAFLIWAYSMILGL